MRRFTVEDDKKRNGLFDLKSPSISRQVIEVIYQRKPLIVLLEADDTTNLMNM